MMPPWNAGIAITFRIGKSYDQITPADSIVAGQVFSAGEPRGSARANW
jgi:hypothetical protein